MDAANRIAILMLVAALAIGCQSTKYAVLAATGTNIGVEVSQNVATQSPQAKLGYQRAEFAIVPTNRAGTDDSKASHMGGALDSSDVIMELRYGGIFDLGATSGIYQRLAVGKEAVRQPGASFMFAKGADGNLTDQAAIEVAKAQAAVRGLPTADAQVESEKTVLRLKRDALLAAGQGADVAKFDTAAQAAGYPTPNAFNAFLIDRPGSLEKAHVIRKSLEVLGVKF